MKREVLLVVGLCAGIMGAAATGAWQHGGPRAATAASVARAVQGPQDPVAPVTSTATAMVAPVTSTAIAVVAPVTSTATAMVAPVTSTATAVVAPVTSTATAVVAPVTSTATAVVAPVTSPAEGPQDPTTLADVYGIHFIAQVVAAGAQPTLPNGQPGVPMDQAVSAAMDAAPAGVDHQARSLAPNVQVAAQFTLFSDDRYGQRLASGQVQPYLQDRPAWVVTFSGPGVQLHPHGPRPAGSVHNEVSVVIDAATGQYLMGYSYR